MFGSILSVYDEYILKTTLESRFILKFHEKVTEASASVCLILAMALMCDKKVLWSKEKNT